MYKIYEIKTLNILFSKIIGTINNKSYYYIIVNINYFIFKMLFNTKDLFREILIEKFLFGISTVKYT